MLDLDEIKNTISQLENDKTTFDVCEKLASLYICLDHSSVSADNVVNEYNDILPEYKNYCELKYQYQMGEIELPKVINSLTIVCKEIFEFLNSLYISTDSPNERSVIKNTLSNLINNFND